MNYTVQPGDSLFSIARRLGLSIDSILNRNPQITDPNFIYPGQVILIPLPCTILRQGDTGPNVRRIQFLLQMVNFYPGPIDGIYGPKTQAALIGWQQAIKELEVTGMVDMDTWISLGFQCDPRPAGITQYIVRPGSSLFLIAAWFGITVESILRVNPQITNPNLIYSGQVINIP
ncbi:LysM peptidoglycan-binding domain-containing protein [Bacillus sp. ISL-47]|uniref:LysM peptidoglycan-binding domain-containing protein n=1 Tax=Bacillus sp. ISL-47 TaxID=2819130 RepID=UPI001BE71C08|nr:LysM peptidoglycan-binding domain-containing protein [Bacillus sp. ISL-47]MBT2688499.1 LysM peptidoglycan-binding domain-containing protein [Bacillus sp. ISL-47]MBT2709038.1 LysM peptidoglycan-binding domain-containing protein [Pseudomonas sp. ISL-84]